MVSRSSEWTSKSTSRSCARRCWRSPVRSAWRATPHWREPPPVPRLPERIQIVQELLERQTIPLGYFGDGLVVDARAAVASADVIRGEDPPGVRVRRERIAYGHGRVELLLGHRMPRNEGAAAVLRGAA